MAQVLTCEDSAQHESIAAETGVSLRSTSLRKADVLLL